MIGVNNIRINISTILLCDFQQIILEVKKPKLLEHVAYPLVKFMPVKLDSFPKTWVDGIYWVNLKLFGILPFGKQAIVISYPAVDKDTFILRDNGYSNLIKTWDHIITIKKHNEKTFYSDSINISAGIFTPIIYLFAFLFYKHRQRRLKKLVRCRFDY